MVLRLLQVCRRRPLVLRRLRDQWVRTRIGPRRRLRLGSRSSAYQTRCRSPRTRMCRTLVEMSITRRSCEKVCEFIFLFLNLRSAVSGMGDLGWPCRIG